ncbi:MAG: discoidin domain-containing protein, partial [Clostridia bacterium]|nr:discoidin domain-containing protein [Clostridia bacterium]
MKKTLATLLVLAMVVSVCGMLFASAGANDAVAELKAELEALVGADVENAAGEWNVDVTVDETGKVTAVFNIAGLEDKGIVIVEAPVFYDADKLTLLNTINSKDNSIDCITVMPDDSGDWENFCSMGEIADGIGQLTLSILNVEATTYINESSLEFTLEFQLAEGESLAGLYIPSNDDNYASDESFEPMYLNGTYGIVCTIEEEPVENTKVEVNVNENAILTDGKTGFTGAWGAVGTGDVALVTNGNCTAAGMDVTLSYALGATKLIDSVTVDLYHCANVMIGYPEGQATVLVSVDGETWTEAGKYDLAAADLALDKSGTVSNTFSFTAVEAAYVKVLLYAGSNEAVLGANPAAGKIFWEFISVAEFAVNEVKIPTNLAAGKEWTGDTECGSGYVGDITDGKIDTEGKYDTSIWYGFDRRKTDDAVGTIIIDLGAIYTNIDEIRAFVWPLGASGIAVPQSYDFYVSKDGETYTLVTSVAGAKGAPVWVGTDNEEGLTARYVKLDIVGTTADTFWFIGELEVNSYDPKVVEVAVPAEPGNLAAGKEWTGDTESGSSYVGDITDGKIDTEGKYDTSIWYGFDRRKTDDAVGTIIIDLGKLYSGLDEIRAFVWPAGGAGIAVHQSYYFYISEDGE